tara:strand:+ start:158 stop:403 length:246 start_codon:yes stop_codon:yes gene_type:complete
MKIRYFAWIEEITKTENEFIDSEKIKNLEELKVFIIKKYPDLKKHFENGILRFAVNEEYIVQNISLTNDDVIAIFPPVSGG